MVGEITASQRFLSYARICINLDLHKPKPSSIGVDLAGDSKVVVEVLYENVPCSLCLGSWLWSW